MMMSTQQESGLPPPPRPPEAHECCGNGCDPCVYQLYDEALERWERRVARIRARRERRREQGSGGD